MMTISPLFLEYRYSCWLIRILKPRTLHQIAAVYLRFALQRCVPRLDSYIFTSQWYCFVPICGALLNFKLGMALITPEMRVTADAKSHECYICHNCCYHHYHILSQPKMYIIACFPDFGFGMKPWLWTYQTWWFSYLLLIYWLRIVYDYRYIWFIRMW